MKQSLWCFDKMPDPLHLEFSHYLFLHLFGCSKKKGTTPLVSPNPLWNILIWIGIILKNLYLMVDIDILYFRTRKHTKQWKAKMYKYYKINLRPSTFFNISIHCINEQFLRWLTALLHPMVGIGYKSQRGSLNTAVDFLSLLMIEFVSVWAYWQLNSCKMWICVWNEYR